MYIIWYKIWYGGPARLAGLAGRPDFCFLRDRVRRPPSGSIWRPRPLKKNEASFASSARRYAITTDIQ